MPEPRAPKRCSSYTLVLRPVHPRRCPSSWQKKAATLSRALDENDSRVLIEATVRTSGQTGVEMEALTAVSVAGLTIYDMAKAVDRSMRVEAVRLVEKHGGQSGDIVLE